MRSDTTRETDTRNRMCGDWVVTTFRELKRRRRLGPMLARCPDHVQVCVELGWLALASPGTLLAQESSPISRIAQGWQQAETSPCASYSIILLLIA